MNHWKTAKGKETLYNVFSAIVELRNSDKVYVITFWDVTWKVSTKGNYKNAYVTHALKELIRLGFVRRTKYMKFIITPKGWDYWNKRKQLLNR